MSLAIYKNRNFVRVVVPFLASRIHFLQSEADRHPDEIKACVHVLSVTLSRAMKDWDTIRTLLKCIFDFEVIQDLSVQLSVIPLQIVFMMKFSPPLTDKPGVRNECLKETMELLHRGAHWRYHLIGVVYAFFLQPSPYEMTEAFQLVRCHYFVLVYFFFFEIQYPNTLIP